jgi:Zn ribbon nucleic-acid-binding protein
MSNEKLANEFVLPWAHCPQCSRNDKWRMIMERIVPDLPTYKHECECGYVEGDKAGPLGTVSTIPRPADDRGAPYGEPVTRLERIVCTVMLSPNAGSEKYAAAEVVAYAREIIVEMSKIEKEFGA